MAAEPPPLDLAGIPLMDAGSVETAEVFRSLWGDVTKARAVTLPRLSVALAGLGDAEQLWLSGSLDEGVLPLFDLLDQVAAHGRDLPALRPILRAQGAELARLGLTRAQYRTLGCVLADVFSVMLGIEWTPSRNAAWTVVWTLVTQMLAGAEASRRRPIQFGNAYLPKDLPLAG